MNVRTLPSTMVAKAAAQALNASLAAQQGKEFLFLSSGGSSLSLLEYLDPRHFGPHSTIGVLDERYSADPTINNLALLEQTGFYKKVQAAGAHFIDTKVRPGESIESVATRFEKSLRDWAGRTGGTILASVGVGPDAHTSGIMPYPEDPHHFDTLFNDEAHWVAAYDAHDKNPHRLRITTTFPFLRKIDSAIIFIVGENKRPALKKMLAGTGTLSESPCRIWREVAGAEVYTDQKLYAE
ncbi:MAG: 6-phosphogluconolactonase [Minisyncoccota bacterium]